MSLKSRHIKRFDLLSAVIASNAGQNKSPFCQSLLLRESPLKLRLLEFFGYIKQKFFSVISTMPRLKDIKIRRHHILHDFIKLIVPPHGISHFKSVYGKKKKFWAAMSRYTFRPMRRINLTSIWPNYLVVRAQLTLHSTLKLKEPIYFGRVEKGFVKAK